MENAGISRRKFLVSCGGAIAGTIALTAMGKPGKLLAAEEFSGYPDRFGMLTDTTMVHRLPAVRSCL